MMRNRGLIPAIALTEETGDTTDGGDADGGALVNLPVRPALQQIRHDTPAIHQCFKLGAPFVGS